MTAHGIDHWRHSHDFHRQVPGAERNTRRVMLLTAAMMVAEIAGGTIFGSMALLADGWHMATHVAAFAIALFAYDYARRHAGSPRFTFGTGKVTVLGGFASAVALAVVALFMALESVARLFSPGAIAFDEAMAVAVLGLAVNLLSGWMLHDHHHDHDHDHDHDHEHAQDHNLRAAYLHVLADALTSVFAIVALLCGKYFGWLWVDPLMGIVGAVVIARWSAGLVRETGHVLLDGIAEEELRESIRAAIESDADNRISDLHVWYVGPQRYSASVSVITHRPREPAHYKSLLAAQERIVHLVVEVNTCCAEQSATV